MAFAWNVHFLQKQDAPSEDARALIILNQPFSRELLIRVWNACIWRACADGGANRLYDLFDDKPELRTV